MNNYQGTIFSHDEMSISRVKSVWTRDDLLAQDGIFFFKDISKLLEVKTPTIKARVIMAEEQGQDPWQTIGIRKIWTHWLVRMPVFAPVYKAEMEPPYTKIPPQWDGNKLLGQKGVFLLAEVCRKIPFSGHQLRYQARICQDSYRQIGIWKCEQSGVFLVQMEIFSPWLQQVWLAGMESIGECGPPKPGRVAKGRGKQNPHASG